MKVQSWFQVDIENASNNALEMEHKLISIDKPTAT